MKIIVIAAGYVRKKTEKNHTFLVFSKAPLLLPMVIIDELDLSVVCLDGYIYYEIVNGKKKRKKEEEQKKKKKEGACNFWGFKNTDLDFENTKSTRREKPLK